MFNPTITAIADKQSIISHDSSAHSTVSVMHCSFRLEGHQLLAQNLVTRFWKVSTQDSFTLRYLEVCQHSIFHHIPSQIRGQNQDLPPAYLFLEVSRVLNLPKLAPFISQATWINMDKRKKWHSGIVGTPIYHHINDHQCLVHQTRENMSLFLSPSISWVSFQSRLWHG